jgi:hypothetical protein
MVVRGLPVRPGVIAGAWFVAAFIVHELIIRWLGVL